MREILYTPVLPRYYKVGEMKMVLPAKPEWCYYCQGSGMRSKWDIQGLDIDQMLADDDDGSMRELYFGGGTDVCCNKCNGKGAIAVPDYEACNDEQKAFLDEVSEIWDSHNESEAISAAERRMGA